MYFNLRAHKCIGCALSFGFKLSRQSEHTFCGECDYTVCLLYVCVFHTFCYFVRQKIVSNSGVFINTRPREIKRTKLCLQSSTSENVLVPQNMKILLFHVTCICTSKYYFVLHYLWHNYGESQITFTLTKSIGAPFINRLSRLSN